MSEIRRLPSEVFAGDAGEVLEVPEELTAAEELRQTWNAATHHGSRLLEIPPRRWLVRDWLPLDAVVVLYAAPGVGKSFYALSLALEVASGGRWLGESLEAAPVLYVAAERATEIRDRAEAWTNYYGSRVPERFSVLAPPYPPQLSNASHLSTLCEMVRDLGSRVVVLDTYAQMTLGLEENSSKDTGPILAALSKLRKATEGGLVLVVHHTGKDASRGPRGSSSFVGAVDLSISLEGSEGQLRATVAKTNAGNTPIPEWYKLEPVPLDALDGEDRSSAVLRHTGAPARSPGLEEAVKAALALDSMSMPQLLEALETEGHPVKRSTLQKLAIRPLLDRGQIVQEGQARSTRYRLS